MNISVPLSDPGLALGKTFLKIGQVILTLLILGCGYMGYLASEGLFTGWNSDFDSDIASLFQDQSPDTILCYIFIGLGVKLLVWLVLLFWLDRKI